MEDSWLGDAVHLDPNTAACATGSTGPVSSAPEARSRYEAGKMHAGQSQSPRDRVLLALAALGVVYGDIGTSPLYAWNEIHHTGALKNPADVLGVTSLLL
jgi:KUP system potassium uptake protein